ncbi:MAG: hypothetical protein ACFE9S_11135 [Candidatus Hermodarchaeota archaeon]
MREINKYIDFETGNIPLIISVPHGGLLNCDSIPQRTEGVLGIDKGTIELAKKLIKQIIINFEIDKEEPKAPFSIISKIKRNKIDINRRNYEAFDQNSFLAREIYWFYHNKIEEWICTNIKNYNCSLLIDIHGFERNARPQGFRDVDIILGTNNLESLFSNTIKKRDWGKNIRGKIIKSMLQLDISVAPGHPRRREYVLTGGYITTKYGASQYLNSQTIQIEFSDRLRLHDKSLKESVIKTLARVLVENLNEPNSMMR